MTTEIKPKIHSGHMELAVAMLLNYRVYTIVPNVSHGLYLNHECDMLALKDGKFTEIEIKISIADLKADFKKSHGHKSKYITRLVYAVTEEMLESATEIIPDEFGIISVKTVFKYNLWRQEAYWVRQVKHRKTNEKIPQSIIDKFHHLGCMRIWSLKGHNNNK